MAKECDSKTCDKSKLRGLRQQEKIRQSMQAAMNANVKCKSM